VTAERLTDWVDDGTTHQVKVFARLAEEEALHAIFFGLVHYVVESCVSASANDHRCSSAST